MAFVVIRLIYVDFRVCRKKKGVGDQMGWATAHFQFCVVTLQWCRDRKGAAHTASASKRMTEDSHTCVGVPGEGYHDRPPWALCRDRVGSPYVATRVFSFAT